MTERDLQTAAEVIDALGGTAKVHRLTGRAMQAVSNWRKSGRLPADTFFVVTNALKQSGLSAPPSLWGMVNSDISNESADEVAS